MNSATLIRKLESFPSVLFALAGNLSTEELQWRPGDADWSILEIACHLLDEEIDDFRTRVRMTLLSPDEKWPSINPHQTAADRRYRDQNFTETLRRFTDERQASVNWLRQLQHPDWSQPYQHPQLGTLHAGDLLSAWAAHDLLHLKQITKRIYQQIVADAVPFRTDYAGDWHA